MTMRRLVTMMAALVMTIGDGAAAATKIEGEYQLLLDMRKSQRFFPWDWESNNGESWTGAQLRLFTQPRPGTEAFIKFEADWTPGSNETPRPQFQYREAHIRYRWERTPERGFETYLFSRQDRFWVDNYLLRVVEGGPLGAGGSQGIRLNTWGFLGLNTSLIASDYSDQFNPGDRDAAGVPRSSVLDTDDAYVARVRREFFQDRRLRLGFTYNRKEENQVADSAARALDFTEVFAIDSRYQWKGIDFLVEYAHSRSPEPSVRFPDALDREITAFNQPLGVTLPDHSVVQAEIRTLRLGTTQTGYLNFAPIYWTRGPLWQNQLGGPQRDETGFIFDTYYLLPDRAITYTNRYTRYSQRAREKRDDVIMYNELYIEFVNGFTGKTYLRQADIERLTNDLRTIEEHDDWFNELQVESRLAWLRVQSKLKDIGQRTRKQLFTIENSVNLSDKLKVYNRFAFGNDPSILRKGIFSQLQYRPTGNMEMFLQYGPDYIGGGSTPVDEGNLQGGADQADIVKFILKGTF